MYSADPADHITISPTGVEFVQSVTTLTSTIVIPATALVGDIAVLFDMSTTITNTVPSGWTSISGVAATGIRTNISYRVLTSGQPGATISGMAGTTRKIMMLFRGASLTPTISLSTPGVQSTTAAPTNQSITATQATNIYFAAYGKTTSTTPTTTLTMTNYTSTLVTSVSTSGIFARYIVANPGANSVTQSNATVTMSDAGTNTLQSFRMTIS